mgnify:CR=1 FL=1
MAISLVRVSNDQAAPSSQNPGLTHTFAGPLDEMFKQMQQARESSDRAAAAAKQSESGGCLWFCLVVAGILLSIVGLNVASNGYILYGPGLLMFALGFGRLYRGSQETLRQRAQILDQRKLQFVEQLLQMLSVDLDPEKSQSLEMDLRALTSESCRTRRDRVGAKVRSTYTQEWLRCKLALAGGRRLNLSLRRTQNEKIKQKRRFSPYRRKTVDLIAVTVRPGADPGFRRILADTAPPQQLQLRSSKATPEMVSAVLATQPAEEICTRTVQRNTSERMATPDTVLAAIIYTFYALGRAPVGSALVKP